MRALQLGLVAICIALTCIGVSASEPTRYRKIKLIISPSVTADPAVRSLAIDASDSIATTLGLLAHQFYTEAEIAEQINWQSPAELLLPPHARRSSIIGRRTPSGRTIIRSTFVPVKALNWASNSNGELSVDIIYADPSSSNRKLTERQTYARFGDGWHLVRQNRAPKKKRAFRGFTSTRSKVGI
jgi:hypothetical protein